LSSAFVIFASNTSRFFSHASRTSLHCPLMAWLNKLFKLNLSHFKS
jgi:hypothetical protein